MNGSTIPNDGSVEIIGVCAFGYKIEIAELVIPEGVRVIEVGAFSGSRIRKITLPKSLELVRGNAFGVCDALREVIVLGKSTELELSAFGKMLNDGSPMPHQISKYVHPQLVIKGYTNTSAELCAKVNGICFESLILIQRTEGRIADLNGG